MTDINEMLREAEAEGKNGAYGAAFDLQIKNKTTGTMATLLVYPQNELGQIAVGCEDLIGINPKSPTFIFDHSRTQKSTADQSMTVKEFDLRAEDTLIICDDGSVAAG